MSFRPGRHLQSLDLARQNGDLTYIGRPCKKGHDGRRYTSGQHCVQCAAERDRNPKQPIQAQANSPWGNGFAKLMKT